MGSGQARAKRLHILSMDNLSTLHAAAVASARQSDWQALWQAVAGTALVLPLDQQDGNAMMPRVVNIEIGEAVQAYPDMDSFAEALTTPSDYAELDGAQLAAMLSPQDAALLIMLRPDPLVVPVKALVWIAETFRADVTRSDSAGVKVLAPQLPPPEVVAAMGQTVAALGKDCPEAWLVGMAEPDEDPELVLVLGLDESVRQIEAQIAETITRAVQSVYDRPLAVACPARASPLMTAARQHGIGIGG